MDFARHVRHHVSHTVQFRKLWKSLSNSAKEKLQPQERFVFFSLCHKHAGELFLSSPLSHCAPPHPPPQLHTHTHTHRRHTTVGSPTLSDVPLHSSADPSALQYAAKHWHKRCKDTRHNIFATFCPVSASGLCMILCNLSLEPQWNDLRIYSSVCLYGGIIVDKLNFTKFTVTLPACLCFGLYNLSYFRAKVLLVYVLGSCWWSAGSWLFKIFVHHEQFLRSSRIEQCKVTFSMCPFCLQVIFFIYLAIFQYLTFL